MRVFSFGGGVQSTAVLVLAVQGRVQYDHFLFANVGDDSENPETLSYVREVAWPYAERHGIHLEEVQRVDGQGKLVTLLSKIWSALRSLIIPVKFQTRDGKRGRSRRTCTVDFKIKPIARWLRRHGASAENPATVGLGISTDEVQRARTDSGIAWELLEYPLLNLRLSRADCLRIILEAGLPQPPKSACWFCPFQRVSSWRRLKHDNPELFGRAVELEAMLDARSVGLGIRSPVRLTDSLQPLGEFVSGDQMTLDDALDSCDSGYCFT